MPCPTCFGGSPSGTCLIADAGLDPDDLCPTGPSAACQPGVCDGAGACAVPGAGTPCSDASLCTENDACDGLGACVPGTPLACVDADPCTVDACDPSTGCVFTPAACPIDAGVDAAIDAAIPDADVADADVADDAAAADAAADADLADAAGSDGGETGDAGGDGGASDGGAEDGGAGDGGPGDASPADAVSADAEPYGFAGGACTCRAAAPSTASFPWIAAILALALGALLGRSRRPCATAGSRRVRRTGAPGASADRPSG
jgi:hypothetical protein